MKISFINKLKISFSAILLGLSFSLSSCNYEIFNGISTTFAPMYDFTKRIVKDNLNVINIVGENEPHGYEPNSPQIAAKTESAKLLVSYGQGIDSFAENMISKDKLFNASTNVSLINSSSNSNVIDPHAWLSIKESKKMLQSIANKLIEIDSSNKNYYVSNLNEALNEFDELDKEYESVLSESNIKTNIFITSHEAFSYIARDYNLIQYGISDIADNEPTANQVINVVNYIYENNIHYICLEELDEPGFVTSIIEELHNKYQSYEIDMVELNAYEGVDVSNWEDEDNYIDVMKDNLKSLAKALGNTNYQG